MTKKQAVGIGTACVAFVGIYFLGALLLRIAAEKPDVSPALLLAVSDVPRMLGPSIAGYLVGYTIARNGIMWAFLFSLVGFVLLESIGHPPWYYEYDYLEFVGVNFFTYFGAPAALAGGCGQLRAMLKTQRAVR